MSIPSVLLLALAPGAATLLFAGWTLRELRRERALAVLLYELAEEADRFTADLPSPSRSPAPEPALAVLPDPEPQPRAAGRNELLSELEEAVARVNDPLATRLSMLDRWERAADLSLAEVSPVPARFRHQNRELADAQSMAQVGAAEMEIEAAWPELLETLVARSDRDLDPLRAHEPLQRALDELVRDLGLRWIDPQRGDPADPARHRSLGVFRRGTAAQAGTVGEVAVRGLEQESKVLHKALIREFD